MDAAGQGQARVRRRARWDGVGLRRRSPRGTARTGAHLGAAGARRPAAPPQSCPGPAPARTLRRPARAPRPSLRRGGGLLPAPAGGAEGTPRAKPRRVARVDGVDHPGRRHGVEQPGRAGHRPRSPARRTGGGGGCTGHRPGLRTPVGRAWRGPRCSRETVPRQTGASSRPPSSDIGAPTWTR